MAVGKRRLKKTFVSDDVECRNFLKELRSLIVKQSHDGLSQWTNPTHNPLWGGVLMWRKKDPTSDSANDLHIGIHTGVGKDGCNKPGLVRDAPLLVVRVSRSLSPKTANQTLRSSNVFKSYRRTSREETKRFDAFYIMGSKSTATIAKMIEPMLESFSKRL
jgi:hypothetical protein